MPVDRFFHPRAGNSRKVTSLSDFEFRVWWTYQMAADDYGVMRASPVVLQAANARLAQAPAGRVNTALRRLIDVGLVVAFEHQEVTYVCQVDWQDFQKVRYPRESHEPVPPAEVLAKCSASTQELFKKHFGEVSAKDQVLPRAYTREEANGNGKGLTADGAAERLTDAFRAAWKAAYGVECSLILKPLEFGDLQRHLGAHGEPRLLQSIAAFFATDEPFVRNAKHPLALWLRDPLKYLARTAVTQGRPRGCTHTPACQDDAAHTGKMLAEKRQVVS
jgi:hypothetical protein